MNKKIIVLIGFLLVIVGITGGIMFFDSKDDSNYIKNNKTQNGTNINEDNLDQLKLETDDECIESNKDFLDENIVSLKVKDGSLSKNDATFILRNNSDERYGYDLGFVIQKERNGKWCFLKQKENIAYPTVGFLLDSNQEKELNVSWKENYGELDKGKYRFIKSISSYLNNDINYNISTEFFIE